MALKVALGPQQPCISSRDLSPRSEKGRHGVACTDFLTILEMVPLCLMHVWVILGDTVSSQFV